MRYILASASPRRKELFTNISEQFDIIPSQVEEIIPEGIDIEKVPEILATQKAADIAKKYPEALVIGADTGVFIDGQMLGKPRDCEDAVNMLRSLSGRTHKVITGCSLQWREKKVSFSEVTEVTFYPLTEEEIRDYVATGEPSDKAGGYGIQGKGMLLVQGIQGDYFNVVGLPVAKLNRYVKDIKNDAV